MGNLMNTAKTSAVTVGLITKWWALFFMLSYFFLVSKISWNKQLQGVLMQVLKKHWARLFSSNLLRLGFCRIAGRLWRFRISGQRCLWDASFSMMKDAPRNSVMVAGCGSNFGPPRVRRLKTFRNSLFQMANVTFVVKGTSIQFGTRILVAGISSVQPPVL